MDSSSSEAQEQASQEASETSEQETTPVPAKDQKEQEWFEPGKFRTAEDMKTSYQENERRYTKLEQEIAEIKRTVPMTPPPKPDPELEQAANFVKGIVQEELKTELGKQKAWERFNTELRDAKSEYPLALEAAVKGYLIEKPTLSVRDAARLAHADVDKARKGAIDSYLSDLDKKKSVGTGEKGGQSFTAKSTSPKNLSEAAAQAMKRFEAS